MLYAHHRRSGRRLRRKRSHRLNISDDVMFLTIFRPVHMDSRVCDDVRTTFYCTRAAAAVGLDGGR